MSAARTWPADWHERVRGDGCPLCAEGRPDENEHGSLRIFSGRVADAYLRPDTPARGYTIAVWRGRHVAEPTELEQDEAVGYWLEVLQVARTLERYYKPAKLNFMTLGNAVPHLHTHVVPRYLDDPDPGRPPWFAMRGESRPRPADEYGRDVEALRAALAAPGSGR